MKAAVYDRYGPPDVVHIAEVPTPEPSNDQILIRVRATTVSSGDWRVRSLDLPTGFGVIARLMFGVFGPRKRILGTELSGVVESVGADVTRFKPGDEVFADCGAGLGAHAEFRVMAEDGPLAHKPANLSFEEASALCFGGNVALDFLEKMGEIRPGQRALINGASGTTGSALVQFAKYFGAEVTGVCSTTNIDLVASIGADHVVDYTKQDFTQTGERYDLIADTAGTAPWSRARGSLTDTGRLLVVLGGLPDMVLSPIRSKKDGKKVISGVASATAANCRRIAEVAVAGHFRPVIDHVYPFEQIVEAHRRVDTGHKVGSVVVRVSPD